MPYRPLQPLAPVIGILTGIAITGWMSYATVNKIPSTNEVQQGGVVPSKLEIKLQDLNRDGQKEVIMKYDGKDYLLTLDQQGRLKVQAYEAGPRAITKQ